MKCIKCGNDDELRFGVCFDCATEGDLRLGRRTTLQHWRHGIGSLLQGVWWRARIDFRCGWERIRRTGDYAPGRDWSKL